MPTALDSPDLAHAVDPQLLLLGVPFALDHLAAAKLPRAVVVVPFPSVVVVSEADGAAREGATQTKRNPLYHYIHGKPYDLRTFLLNSHPGGKDILLMTQGLVDCTPAFESLHAFANRPAILKQLAEFAVVEESTEPSGEIYSFEENGFYRTLVRRVRAEFGATGPRSEHQSITSVIKADRYWLLKVLIQVVCSCSFFALSFLSSPQAFSTSQLCVFAVLAGSFFMQLAFTAMHDASHYAICSHNHWINGFLTRLWTSLGFWVCRVWMLHHVVLHHSFTGATDLDPDVYHFMTRVRKYPRAPRAFNVPLLAWLGARLGLAGWAMGCALVYLLLPGLWLGQAILYFVFSFRLEKNLWGMTYKDSCFSRQAFEYVLTLAHMAAHWYRGSPLVSYVFFVTLNVCYAMCVVGDHDTVDAALTNHVDIDAMPKAQEAQDGGRVKLDWGVVQVSNSSNFANHSYGDAFAKAHGGINYQIEHHLFPTICHVHLPRIAPIVQATCAEFGVPYSSYQTLSAALYSFVLMFKLSWEDVEREERLLGVKGGKAL